MRSGATSKPKPAKHSFTDQILTLCASGRFGVREAIVEATKHRRKPEGQPARQQDTQKAG